MMVMYRDKEQERVGSATRKTEQDLAADLDAHEGNSVCLDKIP